MDIQHIHVNDLKPSPWRATYVLKPDMNLLIQSLQDYGWLSPVIVRSSKLQIIDGYHRCTIAMNDKQVLKRDQGVVPCIMLDCDEIDAMVLHVRMNRARGALMAKDVSHIVRQMRKSRKYSDSQISYILQMTPDELHNLADGMMLKKKKVAEHQYSKAWVPVEAPANLKEQASFIERPPNADR